MASEFVIEQGFTSDQFKPVRKLPVIVRAMEITLEYLGLDPSTEFDSIVVATKEGHSYSIELGDFLMEGVDGELYPCERSIYMRTYESAE